MKQTSKLRPRNAAGWLLAGLLVSAAASAQWCPGGWATKTSGKGVAVCQKNNIYVQTVDLRSGARIRVGYSATATPSASNPNPSFYGRDIQEWWTWASISSNVVARPSGPLFSVTSGSFFVGSYGGNPTQLAAYPIKNRGSMVSIGNDTTTAPLREFRMTDTAADIVYLASNPRDWLRTNAVLGPFTSVVGFHPGNQADSATGRTYFGLRDLDQNGTYETVLLASTNRATKAEIYDALNVDFKSSLNIQFDGSGTSQMIAKGVEYVASSDGLLGRRNFPQSFVVFAAP